MKAKLLFVTLTVLAISSLVAQEKLTLRVSPAVTPAPARVTIHALISPDSENQAVTIEADSPDFFRSSRIELDGAKAPRHHVVEYRNLPSGTYDVRAILEGVDGKERAVAHSNLTVTSTGGES